MYSWFIFFYNWLFYLTNRLIFGILDVITRYTLFTNIYTRNRVNYTITMKKMFKF